MRHQAFRTIALMLGVMLAAAPAAQAGTITYGELVRAAGASRPAGDVRLRLGAQSPATAQAGLTQSGTTSSEGQQSGQQAPNGSTDVNAPADPTISQSGSQIQTIDLGDVTGTVCDCGEIPPSPLPKVGAFPWWTLAGIPLICVSGICVGDDDEPEPVKPTPSVTPTTPVTTPVPEPISLILFGSGLLAVGAGARRRRSRKRGDGELFVATTEEV